MLNPYAPHEPASVLFEEETWLQGCILGSVFYGVQLALFAGCVHLLWAQMTRANRRRHAAFIAYVCVMFALGTIFMVCNAAFTQFAFVTHREYPGGPSAVENDFLADPSDESGNVAFVIQCWLADALLVSALGARFPHVDPVLTCHSIGVAVHCHIYGKPCPDMGSSAWPDPHLAWLHRYADSAFLYLPIH